MSPVHILMLLRAAHVMFEGSPDIPGYIDGLNFQRSEIKDPALVVICHRHNIYIARRFAVFVRQTNFGQGRPSGSFGEKEIRRILGYHPVFPEPDGANDNEIFLIKNAAYPKWVLGFVFSAIRNLVPKGAEPVSPVPGSLPASIIEGKTENFR
jgi:hypothetical protein